MKIPREVLINGKIWKVKRKRLKSKGYWGFCYYDEAEIHLDSSLRGEDLHDTFLHELMHACLDGELPVKQEERFINKLSLPLLETLQGIGWAP